MTNFIEFDTFSESLYIFCILKLHGVTQFIILGTIGQRKIQFLKFQMLYVILILSRIACEIFSTESRDIIVFSEFERTSSFGRFFLGKISGCIMFLNVIKYTELALIYENLSQFDILLNHVNVQHLRYHLEVFDSCMFVYCFICVR